jgi:ABC-type glycerol-3-phosphate transport system permease component
MNKPLAIGLLIVISLVSLSFGALSILPLFWNTLNAFKTEADMLQAQTFLPTSPSMAAFARLRESVPVTQILINTLVPLSGGVLFIQLPLAYLGALGIGAFRPLGRHSEWLLLLFSPWLFVGTITLSVVLTVSTHRAGTTNTLMGLTPPILLSVPMLFVLTLFFKGQVLRWEAAQAEGQTASGAFFRHLIVPSLPLAALLAGIAIFWGLQDLLWPLIIAATPNRMTVMTALLRLAMESGMQGFPVVAAAIALLWLPVALLFFLFFGIFQIFYLDRLSISR